MKGGTDLTNNEIAGLRAYFRSSGFKYPVLDAKELPADFIETWGVVYFNALPRLLEEVLRRRFHVKYNEAEPAAKLIVEVDGA